MCADWLKIRFLQLKRNTDLAQTVDVMMVQAKRTYNFIIKDNKLFSTRNRNMNSMLLFSY